MTVGQKVAAARAEAGLTQAQLASAVGLDRSALAKIETNVRRVTAVELVAIANELRRRIDWFIDAAPPAIVSHRAAQPDIATSSMDAQLEILVRDVEFVVGLIPSLCSGQAPPFELLVTPIEAEELAGEARAMLELGAREPVDDLVNRVAKIGLLAFSIPIGPGADGGAVLLDSGGVAIVNGDLHVGRRRLTLAHELGHYLVADPYSTDWRVAATDADAVEARLDRFARALLMPATDLRDRWARWRSLAGETLRDAAVRAGSHYRVDMSSLSRRLSELDLIGSREAAAVRQVTTKRADIVEKNLVVRTDLEPVTLPRPYEQAILKLYRDETISADRALGLLLGTFDSGALPDLPPVAESEIWTVVS